MLLSLSGVPDLGSRSAKPPLKPTQPSVVVKTASKDIILAAAGHDLRQPLQVITMAISVLSRRPLTDRESKFVQRADQAVHQLVDALDERIAVSRVRYGMAQPKRQPVMLDRRRQMSTEQW